LKHAVDHDQARRHLITYRRATSPTTSDHVSVIRASTIKGDDRLPRLEPTMPTSAPLPPSKMPPGWHSPQDGQIGEQNDQSTKELESRT